MKEISRIPKKGELFVYNAYNIREIIIDKDEEGYKLGSKKLDEEMFLNKYLIFRYLGSGLAREYYSSKIFNFVMLDSFEDKFILNEIPSFEDKETNNVKFYKGYNQIIKNPLVIYSSSYNFGEKIFEVDSHFKSELVNNSIDEEEITSKFEELEKNAKEKLLTKMNEIIGDDFKEASELNRRYNLKKTYNDAKTSK